MSRGEGGVDSPKPKAEIEALISIIKRADPDLLGVCELGDRAMFKDLLRRLNQAGLRYTHSEYVEDAPDERHLALFSRIPIVSRQSLPQVPYSLNGRREKVRRGFLDVTVKTREGYELRLIGAHLKSKRPVPEGEALVRRHEARLLRKRIEGVLESEPDVNLLVYGDFNDTKNEPAIHEIAGVRGAADYMEDVWLHDDRGERWTYYWKFADQYSRIDYIFVNSGLKREVDFRKSYIARPQNWYEASDHCLILVMIDPDRER